MKALKSIGEYVLMLGGMFTRPEKLSMYWKEIMRQTHDIGIGSLTIIAVVSTFVGAVTSVQFANQLTSLSIPIPMWWMGSIVRNSLILELAPTIGALLLAGKVGSNIASELGSMRVTEQIDALEIMGINTKAYLIFPKIIGAMLIIPPLMVISVALGIIGGYVAGDLAGYFSLEEYVIGLQDGFKPYYVTIMIVKAYVFAFLLTSIPCYQGYYVQGGALEIGAASTRAVVNSSIILIVANFLIAYLLL